jgi:hypothetical protein
MRTFALSQASAGSQMVGIVWTGEKARECVRTLRAVQRVAQCLSIPLADVIRDALDDAGLPLS